jgi:uncharacterized protein YyaL (SSP411 family)
MWDAFKGKRKAGGAESEMQKDKPNGINWLDWTEEAFQRAKAENKPVLLDVSAVWCHWCHRLDKDTYSVHDIAEYIESHFIPIRVDTDMRPDINRRYNMGGWPTTAFLTPDGRVIGGGTYFPPDQMRQLMRDVRTFWEKSQGKPTPELEMPQPENIPVGTISTSIIDYVLGEAANNFDPIHGGFGSQPKFPNIDAHELTLLKYHYSGNREFLKMVRLTLDTIGKSGIYDREIGGFFRYSTTEDWSIPHFEKMSEDNAKWLQLYLHAYQTADKPFYADIGRGIMSYVKSWLTDQQNGCFYGSQDADEDYYSHSATEREKLNSPFIDKHIYTNWNAMMISAFLEASFILEDLSARNLAIRSLDRLLMLNYKQDEGMYHFHDGQPRLPNHLADQVQMSRTLCDAYQATGDMKFLRLAEELMEITVRKLFDSAHGGFFDIVVDPNAPGFLSNPAKPLDDNSVAARVLTRLYHFTGKENYHKLAEATLNRFVEIYPQFGFMAADYALAVDAFLNEPTLIRIIGPRQKAQTQSLLAEAHRIYEPRKIIQILDPDKEASRITALGFQIPEASTAYICVGAACTAPITDAKQIEAELSRTRVAQIRNRASAP